LKTLNWRCFRFNSRWRLFSLFAQILRISKFGIVRKLLFYILFLASVSCFSQGRGGVAVPVSFEDSLRIVLENTKNIDASVIGSGFSAIWATLRPEQQLSIRKQVFNMKIRKYSTKPHLVNYIGAIVAAVNIERASPDVTSGFLSVAAKVIDNEAAAKANNFFFSSRTFFEHHALHYEKSFRLMVLGDRYKFDYLSPTPAVAWDDTTQYETPAMEVAEESETDWSDTTFQEAAFEPEWMNPPPPPDLQGPVIVFEKATLNFITKYDSVFLKNTTGSVSLIDNTFVGDGGSFDWTVAGLSADSVYCNFTKYFFNTTKPELRSDLVKLNYTGKTPGLIPGSFEYKSQQRKDSVWSDYPRFKSYQSNLSIAGIGDENVRYTGGFSLTGNKVSSTSFSGDPARIEVYQNGSKKFTSTSPNFTFQKESITSPKAKITLWHGGDSIMHQTVRMRYTYGADSTQRLVLFKDKGDMRYAPYSSTYFNVDFATDVIQWDLYSDSLNMLTEGGRSIVPLIIESVDYYDAEDYRLLQGVGFTFHPLAVVVNFALKRGVMDFYSGDIATATGRDLVQIKKAMEFLSQKGMLTYDSRTDLVHLKDKAIDLYKAFKGETDYDNLKIHSVIDSFANATINLKRGYMTVRGVEEFDVSDSLNVHIHPDSSVITILKNRDIKFDGTIDAGNFEISGKGFTLLYDSFLIDLDHIDSINFFVMETNAKGQQFRRKINNSMVGADSLTSAAVGIINSTKKSGTLYINRSDNKSGKDKVPNYPRLDASSGGVIYFDRHEVLGGVYDRSMFFVVPPFKLDSLNDADPGSINFEGTFVSSGMFPNFRDKLHTQPDKSLGFEHAISPEGYQLYKGDGKMTGGLNMDNKGLRGFGKIEYLAATISSDDYIFYPDSVIARGEYARIAEKQVGPVLFPQASLTDFEMKWFPKQDRMVLKNRKQPFSFYDSTAQMQGSIMVSRNGVAGVGKFETRGTELISRDMKFTGTDFSARHAKFKVKTIDPNKPLFTGTDVRLKFNIKENYADISPEVEGVAAIDFPYAQFRTSIPKARWDLNEQKIRMSKDPNVPIESSYFYTTRKDLDSLRFNADKAEYNLKTQELKVSGIPYIIVADAKITPENNEVLILENAKIGTLKNTTIILDTLNGYHRLIEGVVDIVSRKEFGGYATYQYVNLLNDTFSIKMTDFHLEPIVPDAEGKKATDSDDGVTATQQTVATGSVAEQDDLVMGAGFFYKGDMIMYATRPALKLDGYLKLDIHNIPNYNSWIKYEQSGQETEVTVNFDNAVTESGKKATAGLHFTSAGNEIYGTFINDKKSEEDDDFFVPSGLLRYDKDSKEYIIEDPEKAAGRKLSGKVFAYNDERKSVRFEGPVQFFNGMKDFNVSATALGNGDLEKGEYKMNSLVIMDSNVPPAAFDLMAVHLQNVIKNEGATEGLGDQTDLLYKIADVVGERFAKEYEQNSLKGYTPLATLPPLIKPLVFADVNLKWHPKLRAFYSEGHLGVSNAGKQDINGAFEGFMEIKKTEDGTPVFNVFFKASPEAWYYFGFEDNRLMVHSSNGEFNDFIGKKTNAGKAKVGEIAFIPGSDDETLSFINRFRRQYYGIEVPYELSESAQEAPEIRNESRTEIPTIQKETDKESTQDKPEKKRTPKKKTETKPEETEQDTVEDTETKPEEKQPEEKKEEREEDDGF
jgi:hypothetical protein